MIVPKDGPLYSRGPYIRNAQPIGHGLFLVEGQKGRLGKGRVWSPTVVLPNPEAGTVHYAGSVHEWTEPTHRECGYVKPATSQYRKGLFKAYLWSRHATAHLSIEGYFATEHDAVQFMIRTAPEFCKP
jgi:hypothetical protein